MLQIPPFSVMVDENAYLHSHEPQSQVIPVTHV